VKKITLNLCKCDGRYQSAALNWMKLWKGQMLNVSLLQKFGVGFLSIPEVEFEFNWPHFMGCWIGVWIGMTGRGADWTDLQFKEIRHNTTTKCSKKVFCLFPSWKSVSFAPFWRPWVCIRAVCEVCPSTMSIKKVNLINVIKYKGVLINYLGVLEKVSCLFCNYCKHIQLWL